MVATRRLEGGSPEQCPRLECRAVGGKLEEGRVDPRPDDLDEAESVDRGSFERLRQHRIDGDHDGDVLRQSLAEFLERRILEGDEACGGRCLQYREQLVVAVCLRRQRSHIEDDPGPATLRHHDAVIGCLRGAGFSVEMAAHAFSMLDSYIYGFALQETDMASETPDDFAAEAQRQMREYEAVLGDYPNLVEVVGGHVAKAGYDYDARSGSAATGCRSRR